MPFLVPAQTSAFRGGLADALAYDITTRLARLRSLFVIAQGSVFALHERQIGPQEAGRMLNVDYVVASVAGEIETLDELWTAIELSPNLAQAHYALAFVQSQAGDAASAIGAADLARALSPFDPLLFAMYASRAMALMRLGRFDEAAERASRAVARPDAHPHIFGLAGCSLALAGKHEETVAQVANIRAQRPDYGVDELPTAFHFAPDGELLFRKGASAAGLA
ncbi:MAG: transcriptional regulator [Panacagrimonas sp.]|jgi:tetratricopeptide (TPR) repeat protein|nr:hypothetical protein [Panacagrimonas sp.]MCC2655786.1 transcriptional regulator [Panacagrimonas sp.]